MNVLDYTVAKEFPLTAEQNEIVEYLLNKSCAICAAQT